MGAPNLIVSVSPVLSSDRAAACCVLCDVQATSGGNREHHLHKPGHAKQHDDQHAVHVCTARRRHVTGVIIRIDSRARRIVGSVRSRLIDICLLRILVGIGILVVCLRAARVGGAFIDGDIDPFDIDVDRGDVDIDDRLGEK